MALPVSLSLETRPRCSRNQVSSSMRSGRLRSWRIRTLLWGHAVDLALDGEQGIDALDLNRRLVEARQIEELAPPCAQQAASMTGPGLRLASYSRLNPA